VWDSYRETTPNLTVETSTRSRAEDVDCARQEDETTSHDE